MTYVAVAQLLEDGIEAAVEDGRIADGDRRRAPDEVDRVGDRIRVEVLLVDCNSTIGSRRQQPTVPI